MRKIYSTLAIAACVCATASAAKVQQKTTTLESLQQIANLEYVAKDAPEKSAPNHAVAESELTGYFAAEYEWALEGSDASLERGGTSMFIEVVEGNQVAMTLLPWSSMYSNVDLEPLIGTMNLNAGTITILAAANSNIGTFTPQGGSPAQLNLDISRIGSTGLVPLTQVVGTLNDGKISFGEDVFIGVQTATGGYLAGFTDFNLVAPDYFKFVADEWSSVGEAKFTDNLVNLALENKIGTVSVPLLQNKQKPGLFLLDNPYSVGNWAQANLNPTSGGYVYFDTTCPDCVWIRPLTPSGMWLDNAEEGQPPLPSQMYFWNTEGDYVYNLEADPEEVAEVLGEEGTEVSYYDTATRTVYLKNILFGISENPQGTYWFGQYGAFTIELPELGAVDGILNDADTAAKRYFNLQGVEIANPADGELVIVKQGSKASKVIF